jgi:Ca-activated chloride channel family protein
MPLGANAQDKIAEEAYGQAQAPMAASGKGAVDRAAQEGQLQSANVAPQAPGMGGGGNASGGTGNVPAGQTIRVIGSRTFLYQDGAWIDTSYDPQAMKAQQVVFLSDAYFKLLAARPDLSAALALGDQVTVVVGGQAYQVVAEGQPSGTFTLPATLAAPLPTVTVAGQPVPEATAIAPLPSPAPTEVAAVQPAAGQPGAKPPESARPARPNTCFAGLLPLALAALLPIFLKIRR